MSWTALVPIKPVRLRKSRLAPHLSPFERMMLSHKMLDHVVDRLRDCGSVARVLLLSPSPIGSNDWVRDLGRGLNEELGRARSALGIGPMLVIHADLPLLKVDDVDALLGAALRQGQAIAPDRHRAGTNAIAIADGAPLDWRFGGASFARHRSALRAGHAVIERPGLLLDCDTRADLAAAEASGFIWRSEQDARFLSRVSSGKRAK